jgi:hypothetical protein
VGLEVALKREDADELRRVRGAPGHALPAARSQQLL